MIDIVRFAREGSQLQVHVRIPPALNGDKDQYYTARVDLGGSDVAVAALVQHLQRVMEDRISAIRKAAYLQGAKDRARKATHFSGSWHPDLHRGGCEQ
jgi:hypothetical protein